MQCVVNYICGACKVLKIGLKHHLYAALAHLVEQLICNHQVASSIPAGGTTQKCLHISYTVTKYIIKTQQNQQLYAKQVHL